MQKRYMKNVLSMITLFLVISASAFGQNDKMPAGESVELTPVKTVAISQNVPIKEGTVLRPVRDGKIVRPGSTSTNFPAGSVSRPQTNSRYVRPTGKERFKRYLNRTVGTGLIGVGIGTTIGHFREKPPEWEKNAEGFARRLASNFGENAIEESLVYGLEEALSLDGKFYKSKKKDFGSRVKNALISTFTARNKGGKRVFNPSRVAGAYTSNIISTETWYPERFSYKDGLRQATRGIGFNIGLNFVREFIF